MKLQSFRYEDEVPEGAQYLTMYFTSQDGFKIPVFVFLVK